MGFRMTEAELRARQSRLAGLRPIAGINVPEKPKKQAKYRNKKVDGYDSKREAAHAQLLDACRSATERSARVVHIIRQPRFELVPKQDSERSMAYVADFLVLYADGHYEVHDAKGMRTSDYIIKRKLLLERYEIRVREV